MNADGGEIRRIVADENIPVLLPLSICWARVTAFAGPG